MLLASKALEGGPDSEPVLGHNGLPEVQVQYAPAAHLGNIDPRKIPERTYPAVNPARSQGWVLRYALCWRPPVSKLSG